MSCQAQPAVSDRSPTGARNRIRMTHGVRVSHREPLRKSRTLPAETMFPICISVVPVVVVDWPPPAPWGGCFDADSGWWGVPLMRLCHVLNNFGAFQPRKEKRPKPADGFCRT